MIRVHFHLMAVCVVCVLSASTSVADDPVAPFTKTELSKFLLDGRIFLTWVKENQKGAVVKDVSNDAANIASHTNALAVIQARGWDPPRFCYVLNHVLIGYQALGAGWNPEALIDRLEKTRVRARATKKLSEAEKVQCLAQIDLSIQSIRTTQQRFQDIPGSEVRLMLKERNRLEETFRDVMPIAPVAIPNI